MNSKRICAALSVFAISVFSQQLTPGYAAQTTSQRASSGASRVPARVPGVLPVRNQSHSLTQLPSAGGMHGAGPWKTSKSQLRSIAGKAADSNAILSQASPSPFYSGTNYAGITHTNDIDPPDPTMAAGPNNLVIATNTGVQWIAKTGSSRSTLQSISTFFSPLGQVANDITTDPWTVYDPYINRFWVLATSFSNNPNRSTLLFAISSSSDANQGWNFFSFDATLNGSTQANIACDRPTLGFDAQAIYVTCDMYTFPLNSSSPFQYAKIWVITKSQFINNGPTVYYWSFWSLTEGTPPANAFMIVPARMYGAATSDGEYLVDAMGSVGSGGNTLEIWHITNPQNCCVPGNQTAPNLSQLDHTVGSYGEPIGGRQPNTPTLVKTNDARLLFAIWKGGQLTTGQNLVCPGGGGTCAGFTQMNVSTYPLSVTTITDATTPNDGTDRYFPHVDVNSSGYMTMVYTSSSATQNPGVSVLSIPPSTVCTNCSNSETLVQAGGTAYLGSRWGDYSGASADPDGSGVWVHGEFSAGTLGATWGTQVALTYEPASQQTWVRQSLSQAPQARYENSSASDQSGNVVSFGGYNLSGVLFQDTWIWSGNSWTLVHPLASPSARTLPAMALDKARGTILLFGGGIQGGVIGDTWSWNGTNWTKLNPKHSPAARVGAMMTYVPSTANLVLFGGQNSSINVTYNDTWTWNGSDWTQVRPKNSPGPRTMAMMAYDTAHAAVILFGGEQGYGGVNFYSDTWKWDGSNWTKLTPSTNPGYRSGGGMDFDSSLNEVIMWGGINDSTNPAIYDTRIWTWTGTNWQTVASPTAPSGRYGFAFSYSSQGNAMVLFGGFNNLTQTLFGETWTY